MAQQSKVNKATKDLQKALQERYRAESSVRKEGTELIIPSYMSEPDAAQAIMAAYKASEEEVTESHDFEGLTDEVVYAFKLGVESLFGRVMGKGSFSFFGARPPTYREIQTGPDSSVNCPYGAIHIPGLPIQLNLQPDSTGATLYFTGKRSLIPLYRDLCAEVHAVLKTGPLYRCKAFDSDMKFLDVSREPANVIYTKLTQRAIQANILLPIERSNECRENAVPLKRGILLSGKYGTGKTLTSRLVASVCARSGWTFVLAKPDADLATIIEVAQRYQPSVLFFEDVDSAFESRTDRSKGANAILNVIDGALSKDAEVISIFSTNHPEKISKAMLRPGRLDAVIELTGLDGEALVRFFDAHCRDRGGKSYLERPLTEDDGVRLEDAGQGYSPAYLKEAASKATLYAMAEGRPTVNVDDLIAALAELRQQFNLMQQEEEKQPDALGDALVRLLLPKFDALSDGVSEVKSDTDYLVGQH